MVPSLTKRHFSPLKEDPRVGDPLFGSGHYNLILGEKNFQQIYNKFMTKILQYKKYINTYIFSTGKLIVALIWVLQYSCLCLASVIHFGKSLKFRECCEKNHHFVRYPKFLSSANTQQTTKMPKRNQR
jgi:hypothetical protein